MPKTYIIQNIFQGICIACRVQLVRVSGNTNMYNRNVKSSQINQFNIVIRNPRSKYQTYYSEMYRTKFGVKKTNKCTSPYNIHTSSRSESVRTVSIIVFVWG